MIEGESSQGWERHPVLNKFERTFFGKYGQKVREDYHPNNAFINRWEAYADGSQRHLATILTPEEEDTLVQSNLRITLLRPELRLNSLSGDAQTFMRVRFDGSLEVSLLARTNGDPSEKLLPIYDSVIDLAYAEQGITSCEIRAETKSSIAKSQKYEDGAASLSIDQGIIELINKFAEKEEWERQLEGETKEMLLNDFIEEEFVKESVAVRRAQEIGSDIWERVIHLLPPDDRERGMRLLQEVGFYHELLNTILSMVEKNDTLGISLNEINPDAIVSATVAGEIRGLEIDDEVDSLENTSSQILSVDSFNNEGLVWSEIEENPAAVGWEKYPVKEGMVSEYEEPIRIQENTFIIRRVENNIAVNCLDSTHTRMWMGAFLLTPRNGTISEVVSIIKDPEQDFRKVRKLLGATVIFEK